tara:strand:- start:233 stop:835 length:603 start_codon:yes stop_codon:yes gene_type:complete
MKKILVVMIVSFIVSSSAYALSGAREKIEYQSCYSNMINDGESASFAKAYCKCVADQLDRKYTDKQLDKLVSKGYDQMTNKIRPLAKKCYNKTKQTSANQGSKIINLICYMNDPNSPLGSPHLLKIYPDRGYFELPEYRMKVTTLRKSSEVYSGTYEMGVNVKWYLNRRTGAIDYVLSKQGYESTYHSGICEKTSGKQKF